MIPGDRVTVVFVQDTPACDAAEPLFFRILSLQPLNGLNSSLFPSSCGPWLHGALCFVSIEAVWSEILMVSYIRKLDTGRCRKLDTGRCRITLLPIFF